MNVDLPHLHGILKDKTRARILELLEQRDRLSYVELQNLLEMPHTGKLNYHLKILGDLISKDDQSGHYTLSEKGKAAIALLGRFQTKADSGATALKLKLKLGVALGIVVAMAALSLFIVVIGIPGSSDAVSLTCTLGNGCSAASQETSYFTRTFYALIPLLLAAVAGLGFCKRKTILIWVPTGILFAFAFFLIFSIGILYFPFGTALLVLGFVNKRNSRA